MSNGRCCPQPPPLCFITSPLPFPRSRPSMNQASAVHSLTTLFAATSRSPPCCLRGGTTKAGPSIGRSALYVRATQTPFICDGVCIGWKLT
ncbi:hypothetical protein GALMADRAFT_407052 [Galerina marginata CBS 339.88]|uniref:Uncharacterized protein n=1 Tax=Galerina marginata (strain CBS 339.88) TaxID=685588 RepID=A0A067T2Y3_GALM3|nr:hypothetical protein GALMADRAFT_407052 [Galerina marginata CBS 339.88]